MLASLAALCTVLAIGAQPPDPGIVPHPEQLRFEPTNFAVPRAESFRHSLSNGVEVYVAEDRALPLVDVVVALPIGDFLDGANRVGLASLTTAMIRRSGSQRLDANAFDEAVDFLGADLDTHPGARRTVVTLNCSREALHASLQLLVEMIRTPRFQQDRLDQAKSNLFESMRHRNDDPLRVLHREWHWLISGIDHFESRQLTAPLLAGIERQDLTGFHRAHWRPEGMVIAVSGDVETKEILSELERLLGDWSSVGGERRREPETRRRPAKPGLYHLEMATPQAKVALGHLGAERRSWADADAFALTVMSQILGGANALSRLLSRLRAQERLVYRLSASFGIDSHDKGRFEVFFESKSSSVAPAVQLALEEIRRLRREPVPEVELELAKRELSSGFPLLFDSAEEIAGRFAEDAILGRPHDYWHTYRQHVEAVTAADVLRVAKRYLKPDQIRLLVVGPWSSLAVGAGGVRLEDLVKGKVHHLPWRDPLTLDPLPR